jgi:putative PIN family toxin of toxin-antitoxin system
VVIDTNVLISSIIGQAGYSHKIFNEIVFTGEIKICLSQEILAEYIEVANRQRFKKYASFTFKATQLISSLQQIAIWVEPKEIINVLPDKDDNKFIEAAVEANASYIVSGNTNDFIIKDFRGITICTPKEFYEKWSEG